MVFPGKANILCIREIMYYGSVGSRVGGATADSELVGVFRGRGYNYSSMNKGWGAL